MQPEEDPTRRRETIKIVEKGNLLANRRQERERRKTQVHHHHIVQMGYVLLHSQKRIALLLIVG